jgi:hypothetical protein
VLDGHMSQVGRQHGQAPLDVFARAVPTKQGLEGEAMAIIPLSELSP